MYNIHTDLAQNTNKMDKDIQRRMIKFTKDRDRAKYHTPKDLTMQINIEAWELLELLCEDNKDNLTLNDIKSELADVYNNILLTSHYTWTILQSPDKNKPQKMVTESAMKISVFSSQLQNLFLRKNRKEQKEILSQKRQEIDKLLQITYNEVIWFANRLKIDIIAEANKKIDSNEAKYPIDKIKWHYKKYNEI